jgi:hypothetical protein
MTKGGHDPKEAKPRTKSTRGRATTPITTPAAPAYDAAAGEKALGQMQPLLSALPADEIETPRLDLELAALGALRVAHLVRDPSLRQRLQQMPGDEFDPTVLDQLEPLAWAAWHAHRAQQVANLSASKAVVPVALAEAATELEKRMQRCVEYHLEDHPQAGVKVGFLRSGSGYRDLAGDLMGYAELYRAYRDELSHDRKQYREGDADEAERLAKQLFETLAHSSGAAGRASSLRDRAWTLLARCYEEVAAAGRWLLRHEPKVDALFPSLHAASRVGQGRSRPGKDAPSPGEEPAPAPATD